MAKGAHYSISRGGGGGLEVFVAFKLFISTRIGGALKILNFLTCLYTIEIKYLFHAVCSKVFISNILQLPHPTAWRLNSSPLIILIIIYTNLQMGSVPSAI